MLRFVFVPLKCAGLDDMITGSHLGVCVGVTSNANVSSVEIVGSKSDETVQAKKDLRILAPVDAITEASDDQGD